MEAEFSGLVQAHRGLLVRAAGAYCADRSERDDLFQEIVAALWRSFPGYDRARPFGSWAYRVALNVAISFGRRTARLTRGLVPDVEIDELSSDAGESEELKRLRAAIGRLDDLDRAIVLASLEGYDHAAIAEMFGISASNVSTKLHRLRQRLREDIVRQRREDLR